jgi:linearmycin/streptolysin S transport system ATP-binding protein
VASGDKEELINQIGESDAIRISLPRTLIDEVMKTAGTWPGVLTSRLRRGKLEIQCEDGAAIMPRLQAHVTGLGESVQQLEVIRPNLETLYLKVTGRALRE